MGRLEMGVAADRCLALWFPNWSVTAWALADGEDPSQLAAVVAANRVLACSAAAAEQGVAVGQRRREAQSTCPQLKVLAADDARDAREFEAVLACVEQLSPGVQLIRPGLCVVRSQGLASYLGAEELAAETLLESVVVELGIDSGRAGVADGVFTAVQAAHQADPVRVVEPTGGAKFLAPLPVSRLGDPNLSELLPRLGVRTLGDFAAMDAARVRERFGAQGVRLHTLAGGQDSRQVTPRQPPAELIAEIDFEPPLTLVDQVAFASRAVVAKFIDHLTGAGLVCTEVRLELTGERDEFSARTWLTPSVFDAAAITDRIRWQLQAAAGNQILSGIISLRLEPVSVDELANHAPGLFGLGPDERVHHAMSRVQAMLGHAGVLTPQIGGGRWLAERQLLVPWGERPTTKMPANQPWPGRIPDPQPATVFPEPLAVQLVAADGVQIRVDERGALSGVPVAFSAGSQHGRLIGWAGPWPVSERAWDAQRQRGAHRFQVVDEFGVAWLLLLNGRGWWAEARYD
ncbi:MAG: DNA polymerase Y family protein [Actinobacteria bacterium]|nr:DNA polymerase Y family protein [Actinomycetota bacterium]MBU4206891.1 DNA polymerase Y family protein [Actinomycetota bacterium]MBU4250052.1 DNA polymerase Y family protein [Actinomycetota bacterium]MBU4408824.1 DNA polymerase Y family protein [Actinomycetota bacterium]MBU4416427.1 DNA polymerase Y family protein [Actinomycetota bacterium]